MLTMGVAESWTDVESTAGEATYAQLDRAGVGEGG